MKRKITALFLSAVMAVTSTASVFADVGSIRVDNAAVEFGDTVPIIVDGYTYAPIRTVFEQMGTVDWDAETKAVIITDGGTTLELYTPTGEIHVNGVEIEPSEDEPTLPIMQDGTTMLPVRAVAEAMGASVNWNYEDSTIDIYSYGYQVEKFKEMFSGVPLPKVIYMMFTDDSALNFSGIDDEVMLAFTDNEGYDELVSAILDLKAVSEESEALGYDYTDDEYGDVYIEDLKERSLEAFSRFSYYLIVGLDSLEDKSDLTGLIGTMLQNTDVTVDDSLSDEESLAAVAKLYESDGNMEVTVNQKLAPLAKAYASDDALDDSADDDSMEAFAQAMVAVLLFGGYTTYLSDYDPDVSAAADMYEDILGSDEGLDF